MELGGGGRGLFLNPIPFLRGEDEREGESVVNGGFTLI